jgi:hypothetical protein
VVGNAHGLCLILEIPLQSANQIFSLFRIITLPAKVLDDTFAVYNLEYQFIGWTYDQTDYVRMTDSDIGTCKVGIITICPATAAIVDAQTITYESELYFQRRPKSEPAKGS